MKLNYQMYGDGAPLIVLHGLFGMLDNWHTVGKKLGEHFRVFAVDQRNHGRSPHSPELNYSVMANDIRDFAQQLRLPSFFLLGHSMGGKVAMATALTYPVIVEKLIVIDIAPRSYPAFHDVIIEALISLNLSSYSSRKEIDIALSARIPEIPIRQFLMKNLTRDDNGSFHWKMNLPVIACQYSNILKGIESDTAYRNPALFIKSTKSSYVAQSDTAEIKRLFPNTAFVDFETGHWIHAESPEKLTETVTRFLLSRTV